MSPMFSVSKRVSACGFSLVLSLSAWGQAYVVPQGHEFSITGRLAGDQVHPAISLSETNCSIVWEDNAIDGKGNGAGIGKAKLNVGSFTKESVARVNKTAALDQIKPQAQRLQNGQTAFVWECKGDIYSRFLKGNSFYTGDIRVNKFIKDQQVDPVITAVPDGGAIIAWSSYGQDGDMWGVFARKISATGAMTATGEFQVNQARSYNQRNPALATLANGNVVVAWVSEQQRHFESVDIFARIFSSVGKPLTDEFLCNTGTNFCGTPAVASLSDGGFTIVWSEKDRVVKTNSWDIMGRSFSASGAPASTPFIINTFLYGDQYSPKIAAAPSGCLVVWSSLGQDGSREGVFGRFLLGGTAPAGDEFMVNTTTASQQIHPVVAWNGVDRFLVTWSGPVPDSGFDLFGQVYILNPASGN